jgi:hypothetical protein
MDTKKMTRKTRKDLERERMNRIQKNIQRERERERQLEKQRERRRRHVTPQNKDIDIVFDEKIEEFGEGDNPNFVDKRMGGFFNVKKNITKKKISKTRYFDNVKKHEYHDKKRGGCSTKKWKKWFTNIFK